jgi:hypothetical protein
VNRQAIAELPKPHIPEGPWSKLRRVALSKSWRSNTETPVGSKCPRRLGGNDCWEATEPIKELFEQISDTIGGLLKCRVEELEEGEPVAKNIITFGIFMIGKSPTATLPTILFTCDRLKPRR